MKKIFLFLTYLLHQFLFNHILPQSGNRDTGTICQQQFENSIFFQQALYKFPVYKV